MTLIFHFIITQVPTPGFMKQKCPILTNQHAEKQRQLSHPPRRELLGSNVGRRITFAVRGAGSIRSTFHNMPVELPPLPTESGNVLLEHAYATSVANRNSK